jgi:hypothetical protein
VSFSGIERHVMSVGDALRTHPGCMKHSRFHAHEMSNNITKHNRKLVVNMLCSVAMLLDGRVFFYVGGRWRGRGKRRTQTGSRPGAHSSCQRKLGVFEVTTGCKMTVDNVAVIRD